ncbi:carboxylate-amine ligase [Tessaracoccus oleiagri]|uniref:Putative glutamate--cysteine ligase 2 n=1 Tax=Tessaracoccus oleiagri TaxID=686624 RepID=A0A1G9L8M1_9ACTN|nr:YbdK family carboxylate-amine ligase [Tessaracoccus oleiagri]SDL58328.1 carboxylate-amine ligase [Tessaracoccus oleiagri]
MGVEFGASEQSTVGIEWEMAIVDQRTLEQVPGAAVVLERVEDPEHGPIRGEYLDSMIELVTGVHHRVADAEKEMRRLQEQAMEWLDPHGLAVLPIGSHPFGDPERQQPREKERYARVAERNAWWGRQMAINGLHVHVGVDDREKSLTIVMALARLSCYFIALTASSPFWRGEDTGFASQRTMFFQQLSTNGPPYRMADWAEYEDYVDELKRSGMIEVPGEIRWDVRPSLLGTVENRLMDAPPTTWEIGAVAAFDQCIVERVSRAWEVGEPVWRLPHWLMRENKWRAARYGLGAEVMTPRPEQGTVGMREGLEHWVTQLEPIAEELGCSEELERVRTLAARGPSYVRQRRVWEATGSTEAVTRSAVDEAAAGVPDFLEAK